MGCTEKFSVLPYLAAWIRSEETEIKEKLQKLFLCCLIFDIERPFEILISPENKKM